MVKTASLTRHYDRKIRNFLKDELWFINLMRRSPYFTDEDIDFYIEIFHPLMELSEYKKLIENDEMKFYNWVLKNPQLPASKEAKKKIAQKKNKAILFLRESEVIINSLKEKWMKKYL